MRAKLGWSREMVYAVLGSAYLFPPLSYDGASLSWPVLASSKKIKTHNFMPVPIMLSDSGNRSNIYE
jgi:hypothetical protein